MIIKIRPTTIRISLTMEIINLKISFFILILQTDFVIFLVGGFPPYFLKDTLDNHFDHSDESSNFKDKLDECLNHFFQLVYFFVHLYALLSFDDFIILLMYIRINIQINQTYVHNFVTYYYVHKNSYLL